EIFYFYNRHGRQCRYPIAAGSDFEAMTKCLTKISGEKYEHLDLKGDGNSIWCLNGVPIFYSSKKPDIETLPDGTEKRSTEFPLGDGWFAKIWHIIRPDSDPA